MEANTVGGNCYLRIPLSEDHPFMRSRDALTRSHFYDGLAALSCLVNHPTLLHLVSSFNILTTQACARRLLSASWLSP